MSEEPQPTEEETSQPQFAAELPSGIARLHDEWEKLGLGRQHPDGRPQVGLEPVVFPEPIGDYTIPSEDVRARLGLSEDAMERLLLGGGLDSILVRFGDTNTRMVSASALERFMEDTGMDTSRPPTVYAPTAETTAALDAIRQEMEEMREIHSRQLQQFKDVLLLELRNLKEQDRDLTSFVYDLTAGLEEVFPKLRKRRRSPPPESGLEQG